MGRHVSIWEPVWDETHVNVAGKPFAQSYGAYECLYEILEIDMPVW